MFRAFGSLPRPDLWLPYVFTSLDAAAEMLTSRGGEGATEALEAPQ